LGGGAQRFKEREEKRTQLMGQKRSMLVSVFERQRGGGGYRGKKNRIFIGYACGNQKSNPFNTVKKKKEKNKSINSEPGAGKGGGAFEDKIRRGGEKKKG